jgi:hypothetical protein
VAEWSKAVDLGSIPKGRGFKPHLLHFLLSTSPPSIHQGDLTRPLVIGSLSAHKGSFFHDGKLAEDVGAEQVEDGGEIGHKLKAAIDGAADLIKDGLVGHLIEALPPLQHLVLLDLLDDGADVLEALLVVAGEGALEHLGLDEADAGVGGLRDGGDGFDDGQKLPPVGAVPQEGVLQVWDGDQSDAGAHQDWVICEGYCYFAEI